MRARHIIQLMLSVCFFSAASSPLSAQSDELDSLREALARATRDSVRVDILVARAHALLDRDTNAISGLERVLALAKELKSSEAIDTVLHCLSQAYASIGDYQHAYEYHHRAIQYRDDLQTDAENQQLEELQEKYKTAQRIREVEMLEKDKALQSLELDRKNEALRRQRLEALRNRQEIELLSRTAEIGRLEHTMTEERLKHAEATAAQHQQHIDILEKDAQIHEASLERGIMLRNILIATALLLVIVGVLLFRRMRDRRHTIELQAAAAEAHAKNAEMEKLRILAAVERRDKEARRRFAHGLLEAQEAERKRLVVALQDSLGRDLMVVKNRLQYLRETTPVNGDLDEAISGIGETLEDVQRLSHDLHPQQLDHYGLGEALKALIARADEASRTRFSVEIGEIDGLLNKDAEVCIYRVVQEGISNVLRHAEAANARVRLIPKGGGLLVRIEDDGRGLPEGMDDISSAGGFGLKGMAERAEMLGGRMTITSARNRGTTIVITLPQSRMIRDDASTNESGMERT